MIDPAQRFDEEREIAAPAGKMPRPGMGDLKVVLLTLALVTLSALTALLRQEPALAQAAPPPGEIEGYLPLALYLPAPELSPPHFYRIEPDGVKVASDYLSEVLKTANGKVFRFNRMPVPIFIERTVPPEFWNAALKGFENWELRTNGQVRFALVGDPSQARIKLVFRREGLLDRAAHALSPNLPVDGGHTTMKWHSQDNTPQGLFSLPYILLNKSGISTVVEPQTIDISLDPILAREDEVRPILLQNVVTHEVGHALGLIGHSPSRTDIMYSSTDEFSRISQSDLNTLFRLYSMKVDYAL